MSAATELTDALVWLEEYNHGREGATDRAVDPISRYRAETMPAGISRADALRIAREHVEAMSTSGYQDAVKLPDKVAAVERFARFLMGEDG